MTLNTAPMAHLGLILLIASSAAGVVVPLATSHKTPAILSRREALSRALALMPLVAVPFGASAANKVGYLYVALELDHIDLLRDHISTCSAPLLLTYVRAPYRNSNDSLEGSDARRMADSAGIRGASVNLTGRYTDPQHPGCARKVSKSGQFITITGADEDGKKWIVKGQTNGLDLLLDFSPKGGPQKVLAKADSLGIRFPDGNVWTKLL